MSPRLAAALLLLCANALPTAPRVIDDLYISYGYALSLIEHGALTWDGARVEGYSNFSWVLGLAVARAMHLPVTWAAKAASWAGAAALIGVVDRRAPRGAFGTALVFAVALWPALGAWAGMGMETTVFAALLCAGWAGVAERAWGWAVPMLVAAACTRPEGGLYAAAAVVLARGRLPRGAWAALGALAVYEAWRVMWFGGAVPTTVVAKLASSDDPMSGTRQVLTELAAAAPVAALALAGWRVERRTLALAAGPLLLHAAMLLVMNGDWMGSTRIQLPGMAAALGAVMTGAPRTSRWRWIALLTLPALAFEPARANGLVPRLPTLTQATDALRAGSAFTLGAPLMEDTAFLIHTLPDGARFETGDIGVPGLIPGVHLVDATGLVDPARARWLAGVTDSAAVDARYAGPDALACVRRYAVDAESRTPRFQRLIQPYRLVSDLRSEGQRHRWWCRPDLPAPTPDQIRARWLALTDRLPELAAVRFEAARVVADQGNWDAAQALYRVDPYREPDAERALMISSGSVPLTAGPRGLGLRAGGWMWTRPLEAATGTLVLEGANATVRVTWVAPGGARGVETELRTPARVPLTPPEPGARLQLTRASGGGPQPVWVRAEIARGIR